MTYGILQQIYREYYQMRKNHVYSSLVVHILSWEGKVINAIDFQNRDFVNISKINV